ncbi:hypothetical protein GGF43_005745, partial [Coemansia sp. RSA 2618]
MADYSAWSQLFRLNPDTPQTPMLSTQELQDELALWGNAQFQLETVDETKATKVDNRKSSSADSQWTMQGQVNPLSFMMDNSELLSAMAPAGQQPWGQQSVVINGVPMLPLAPLPQQQQQQQPQQQQQQPQQPKVPKMVPIAPAPTSLTLQPEQSRAPAARKTLTDTGMDEPEDESRVTAADEDKRRRNTAASARFR